MNCRRCEQYPCRCSDSRDVIAEYYAQRSPPPEPMGQPKVAQFPGDSCGCQFLCACVQNNP